MRAAPGHRGGEVAAGLGGHEVPELPLDGRRVLAQGEERLHAPGQERAERGVGRLLAAPAQQEHHRGTVGREGREPHHRAVDVGGLGVVDPLHAAALGDQLEPVGQAGEAVEAALHRRAGHAHEAGAGHRRHAVLPVVPAAQGPAPDPVALRLAGGARPAEHLPVVAGGHGGARPEAEGDHVAAGGAGGGQRARVPLVGHRRRRPAAGSRRGAPWRRRSRPCRRSGRGGPG